MLRIELLLDPDCPNVPEARANLRQALLELGLEPVWSEIDRHSLNAPEYARSYGSPTVLVSGRDVAGSQAQGRLDCCRIYRSSEGRAQGAPSVEIIKAALVSSA